MQSLKDMAKQLLLPPYYAARHGALGRYLATARTIEGWSSAAELLALAETVRTLPPAPVIVELGSWQGRSAVVLGGACVLRGDGHVHCVDGFDARGDAHSAPSYQAAQARLATPLMDRFIRNLERAGVTDRVSAHAGGAEEIAAAWTTPLDLLFMDADQSPQGVRRAFEAWSPWLKPGGVLALHNSDERTYAPDHDGHLLLARDILSGGGYEALRIVDTTTFARKL